MRRALLFLALAGCSSGHDAESGPSAVELAQACTSRAVAHLTRVAEALGPVAASPPAGGAFTVSFDLDYDGADDVTLDGSIDGEGARFAISGALTGGADLSVAVPEADTLELTGGSIDVTDPTCDARFTPGSLVFRFGSALAAVVHGARISGDTEAAVTTPGAMLDAHVRIGTVTQQATVDGSLNGAPTEFAFDLFPAPERIDSLAACIVAQDALFREVDFALRGLADIVAEADGDLANLPSTPGLETAAEANPNILNYRLQLAEFGDTLTEGTIVGQLRVSRLNFVLTVLVSWLVDARNAQGGLVAGKSDRFLEFVYDGTGMRGKQGAGALAEPGCDGGFDVDPDDPLPPGNAGGTITYRATEGGETMRATFTGGFKTHASAVSVNGIRIDPARVAFD